MYQNIPSNLAVVKSHFNQKNISNHYLNRYLRFLNYCMTINVNTSNEYSEVHHMLPKSIFKKHKKAEWNLIRLTGRQHFISHWMLSKIFPEKSFLRNSCVTAFHCMTIGHAEKRYYNSRSFEYARKMLANKMKHHNPMHDEQVRRKMSVSQKAQYSKRSSEDREKDRKRKMGVCHLTKEGREKLSNLWKGVSRHHTKEQTDKITKKASCGVFHTPFGEFHSPGQACRSDNNILKLSRFLINKKCKEGIDGFSFIPNGKKETRGDWKKLNKKQNQIFEPSQDDKY